MKPILKIIPYLKLSHQRWKIKDKMIHIKSFNSDHINMKDMYINAMQDKINQTHTLSILDMINDDLCD